MTFRSKIYFTFFAIFEFIVVLVFLVLTARAEQPSDNAAEWKIVTALKQDQVISSNRERLKKNAWPR